LIIELLALTTPGLICSICIEIQSKLPTTITEILKEENKNRTFLYENNREIYGSSNYSQWYFALFSTTLVFQITLISLKLIFLKVVYKTKKCHAF
jgi:hypothetical protein